MNWARKSFVHLLALVLLLTLIGTAAAISFSRNFSKPDKLKTWLTESKVYDRAAEAALNQAQTDSSKNGGSLSVSLSNTDIEKAAQQVFTPELIRQKAETFIDSNYDWLSGKTSKPEFSLDFTQTKLDFAELVGQTVTRRLTDLPVCTAAQQATIQIPVDPLKVECRPSALEPKTEGERVAQEIKDSGDFLSQPVITADTLGHDQSSQQEPYYNKLSSLQTGFQLSKKLPFIFAVAALVSILGVIFIHPDRRKGIKRVGMTFLLAGIVLLAGKFAADFMANKLQDAVLTSTTKDSLQQPFTDFIKRAEAHITQINMVFGILFVLVALCILVYIFLSRESRNTPKAKKPVSQPAADQDHDDILHSDDYPASIPASHPITGTGDITTRLRPPSASRPTQPQPALGRDTTERPSGPPPLKGNPRPRPPKPPRLVQ